MRRRALITATLALSASFLAAPAAAQTSTPFAPWGGENPFNCVLQDVGSGTDFPDPDADPFCVEFDKTSQNVTDFGLVDFLSKEPARVAAASPKCFYFQRDHWTGSIVQGEPPELWHWDGNYFFDKAKGIGGVSFANFRIVGLAADARPYVPDAFKPYLYPGGGGGGALTQLAAGPDPNCVARVDTPQERERVYRNQPQFPSCVPPSGKLHRRGAAGARLGMDREDVIARLGEPHRTKRGVDRWCVIGDAQLRVGYGRGEGKRGAKHAALIRTTSRGHTTRGVGVGTRARKAKRRLDLERRFRIGNRKVFEAPWTEGTRLFAAIGHGRVRWLALTDRGLLSSERATERALRRAS